MSIKLCLIVSIDVIHKTGKDTSTSAHLLIQLPDSNLELKFKDTVRHTGTESGAIEGGGASTSLQEAERWKTLLLLWKDYSIDYGKGFSVAFSLTFFFFVKLSISIIRRTHTLCLSLSLSVSLSMSLSLSFSVSVYLLRSLSLSLCRWLYLFVFHNRFSFLYSSFSVYFSASLELSPSPCFSLFSLFARLSYSFCFSFCKCISISLSLSLILSLSSQLPCILTCLLIWRMVIGVMRTEIRIKKIWREARGGRALAMLLTIWTALW